VTGAARLHPGLVHHIVNTLGWPSLRPLQAAAIDPLLDGRDALLLAPTAGGKTEAATFPTLTAMAERDWRDLSVLYVCPLRALLNNLHPRIAGYAAWLGRTAGLWHGDTAAGQRRRMRRERPDVLLTTPESIESMLVSTLTDPRQFFAGLRTVIVDEVHAFAGDDRGWHLLAVLERLSHLAGRPIQRIGLSATVGNPDALLRWLQGAASASRPGVVLASDTVAAGVGSTPAEVGLDYVGSVHNAATVVAALHAGEKRLVFCESRSQAEQLALALRARQVRTFVSHSSLSVDERRQAEQAFAEARDCVIVATSTLELGVDVGDLDRVIQLDAPATVASFLQRLGRTGRRPGAGRSMLFLATREEAALHAAGLLRLWQDGYVEPVTPPPAPRHIAAQQLLALCLQEKRVGRATWQEWYGDIGLFDDTTPEIVNWLVETGHLDDDGGMLFIGPEAERRFGRRNFMDLLTVFAAAEAVELGCDPGEESFEGWRFRLLIDDIDDVRPETGR
jgi:ATP-dependent Lhr-like helicase